MTRRKEKWFPLAISASEGLGVNFAISRGMHNSEAGAGDGGGCIIDLPAISHLDIVRKEDRRQSLENLKPAEYESQPTMT